MLPAVYSTSVVKNRWEHEVLKSLRFFKSKICKDVRYEPSQTLRGCQVEPDPRSALREFLPSQSGEVSTWVMRIESLLEFQDFQFLAPNSPTQPFPSLPLSPLRHVLGFLGALAVFLIKIIPNLNMSFLSFFWTISSDVSTLELSGLRASFCPFKVKLKRQ